jgi:hypothetical protein
MDRRFVITAALVCACAISLAGCGTKKTASKTEATPAPTPKVSVNLIDIKERPYVTLQPLSDRNMLEFKVQTLPKKATDVEVLLEYDRNKGVLDAVLKNFTLSKIPYTDKLFLGSKSAGGATTYHDDVIGGTLTLTFNGDDTYAVQVPWRYDDTQPHYTELATTDMKFQLTLDQPFRTSKIVVMQSPGLPAAISGQVIAGPYLVRGVGPLPTNQGKLSIRLTDEVAKPKVFSFNGQKWQEYTATVTGRTVTATVPLAEAYVVTQ